MEVMCRQDDGQWGEGEGGDADQHVKGGGSVTVQYGWKMGGEGWKVRRSRQVAMVVAGLLLRREKRRYQTKARRIHLASRDKLLTCLAPRKICPPAPSFQLSALHLLSP